MKLFYCLLAASFYTRCRDLTTRAPVWDEAHFGDFANQYLAGTFYMDVHPPAAKLMLAWVGFFFGYEGAVPFRSQEAFDSHASTTHVYFMRLFAALCGSMVVPLLYATAKGLKLPTSSCNLAALLGLMDPGLIVISRYILLDPLLLASILLVACCLAWWIRLTEEAFARTRWWLLVAALGLSTGLCASIKWVGLFTLAWTLLVVFGTLCKRMYDSRTVVWHYWLLVSFLIVATAAAVYVSWFVAHLRSLPVATTALDSTSSLFQAEHQGDLFLKQSPFVTYGKAVSIRNNGGANGGQGYLYSHTDVYPNKHQQVTSFMGVNEHTRWIFHSVHERVQHLHLVRLEHQETRAFLSVQPHTHAHLTHVGLEASGTHCVDASTLWILDVRDTSGRHELAASIDSLLTLTDHFVLRHNETGCILRSHDAFLSPLNQKEVFCDVAKRIDANSMWNVHYNSLEAESHVDGTLREGKHWHFPLWRQIAHLQLCMLQMSNALKEDFNAESSISSHPMEWLYLKSGIRMTSWNGSRVYMFGSVLVWWAGTVAVACVPLFAVLQGLRLLRHKPPGSLHVAALFAWSGWACHFVPMLLIGRITYLHHYYPCVLFVCLLLASLGDGVAYTLFMAALSLASWHLFGFNAYPQTHAPSEAIRWLNTWTF